MDTQGFGSTMTSGFFQTQTSGFGAAASMGGTARPQSAFMRKQIRADDTSSGLGARGEAVPTMTEGALDDDEEERRAQMEFE